MTNRCSSSLHFTVSVFGLLPHSSLRNYSSHLVDSVTEMGTEDTNYPASLSINWLHLSLVIGHNPTRSRGKVAEIKKAFAAAVEQKTA